ncbi:hypothetical protein GSbR_05500 [Geobacter sp. SVR]|nr:hypothetical protein GSVR_09200 [Geobacter sp. SVR]GCF83950.1 hypothetical protein GSbR_05500 [Geobacter sp. SVR]
MPVDGEGKQTAGSTRMWADSVRRGCASFEAQPGQRHGEPRPCRRPGRIARWGQSARPRGSLYLPFLDLYLQYW